MMDTFPGLRLALVRTKMDENVFEMPKDVFRLITLNVPASLAVVISIARVELISTAGFGQQKYRFIRKFLVIESK